MNKVPMVGLLRFDCYLGQSGVHDGTNNPEVDVPITRSRFTTDIEVSSGAMGGQERCNVARDLRLVKRAAGITLLPSDEPLTAEAADVFFSQMYAVEDCGEEIIGGPVGAANKEIVGTKYAMQFLWWNGVRCADSTHVPLHYVRISRPGCDPAADRVYRPLHCDMQAAGSTDLLAVLIQTISTDENHAFSASRFELKARERELEENQIVLEKSIARSKLEGR